MNQWDANTYDYISYSQLDTEPERPNGAQLQTFTHPLGLQLISIIFNQYSVVKTQNLRVVKSAKRCGHRITGRQINIRDGRLTLLGNLADKSELKHLS